MSIDSIQSGYNVLETLSNGYTPTTHEEEDSLGRDAFFEMLMAQLKYQDPLNPMEGTEMTAQLAQFSSLEQMFTMNENLEIIINKLGGSTDDAAMQYIGKQVASAGNTLTVKDNTMIGGAFMIEEPAEITVSIYDQSDMISSIYLGEKQAGTHGIPWDGRDYAGNHVADGTYTFDVKALDENGVYVPVQTTVTGTVSGVSYEYGSPYLIVEDTLVDPSTIIEVLQSEGETTEDGEDSESIDSA